MPGPLTYSPADVIRQLLIDLALANDFDSLTWPAFSAQEPSSPDNLITVFDTPSVEEGRIHVSGEKAEHHGVQVRVRANTHTEGFAKARAIAVGLDTQVYQATVHVVAAQYLVHSVNRSGGVISLGKELIPFGKEVQPAKRSIFTVNFLVSVRELP